MRFTKNTKGYFLLGLMFFIFVGIPGYVLMMIAGSPFLLGGVLAGSIYVTILMLVLIALIGFVIIGWLIYRFVKTNQFG